MLTSPSLTAIFHVLFLLGIGVAVVGGVIGLVMYYLSKDTLDQRQRYVVGGCLAGGSILLGSGMPVSGALIAVHRFDVVEVGMVVTLVGGVVYLCGLTVALWSQFG